MDLCRSMRKDGDSASELLGEIDRLFCRIAPLLANEPEQPQNEGSVQVRRQMREFLGSGFEIWAEQRVREHITLDQKHNGVKTCLRGHQCLTNRRSSRRS